MSKISASDAHRLFSLLSVIKNLAAVLHDEITPEQKDAAQAILDAAAHIEEILKQPS